jgi:hypothetical protein
MHVFFSKEHLCLFFFMLLFTNFQLSAVDILVKATTRDNYIRPIKSDGEFVEESYTFCRGKYYPYEYENPEDIIRFEEVAFALKEELTKKNYVNAYDPMEADCILVLHWGQTNSGAEDDSYIEFSNDGDDPFDALSILDEYEAANKAKENAKIIGATGLYGMHVYSLKRQQLEEASRHDRYFVNVVAISIDEIRKRPEGAKMPIPLWTLQLSLPTGRAEPEEAFGTLAKTAGLYSGENLANADFVREKEKQGIVRIGKLEIIETIEDSNTGPKE